MIFDIMTLFPDMVMTVLSESILGRAQKAGILTMRCHNIRDYSENKHRRVDDTPYGGGRGMLMAAPPVWNCHEAILADVPEGETVRTVYLSPRGRTFTEADADRLSHYDRLILLCGHYEGIDQRVIDMVADEEISIGDYVLTGGELPACIVADAVARRIDGVLPEPECHEVESFEGDLLEFPGDPPEALGPGLGGEGRIDLALLLRFVFGGGGQQGQGVGGQVHRVRSGEGDLPLPGLAQEVGKDLRVFPLLARGVAEHRGDHRQLFPLRGLGGQLVAVPGQGLPRQSPHQVFMGFRVLQIHGAPPFPVVCPKRRRIIRASAAF